MIRLLYVILLSMPFFAVSQTDSTANQGKVVSGEVVIEKNKEIVLPKADKIYNRGSLLQLDTDPLFIELSSFEPKLDWPPYDSDVPFVRINAPYPLAKYTNYIKLGFGNYRSPQAEVGIFEHVGQFDIYNKLYFESFDAGPVNGSNSANAIGSLNLSAKYSTEELEISPYIAYGNRSYRFYGNTDRLNPGFSLNELPKVNGSNFEFGARLKGKHGNLRYSLVPKFISTTQKPGNEAAINEENEVSGIASMVLRMDNQISTGFELEGYSSNYKGGIDYTRSLFQAKPWLKYQTDQYVIKAGIEIASDNNDASDQTGVYPQVNGALHLDPNWQLFAYVDGGIEWNNLNGLLTENEFLDDSLLLLNIENSISFGAGLNGQLLSNLKLDIDVSLANLANIPFFVPSTSDSSKFTILYDAGSIQRLRLSSNLEYIHSGNAIYSASLELNSYAMNNLERPWHLPLYVIKVNSSHTLKEKIILTSALLLMGGINAPTTVDFGIEELNPLIDISLDVSYKITNRVSAYISTQNLLNKEYERYLGYPVRGVTFKMGGQYRF